MCLQGHQGFESLPLRQYISQAFPKNRNYPTVDCFRPLSLSCKFPPNPAKPIHTVGKSVGKGGEMNRLTTAKVRSLTNPGRYSDGEGAYLNVSMRGSKSWVQRKSIDGIRRDIGLGEYPTVSLAHARDLARQNRSAVASCISPIAEKRRAVRPHSVRLRFRCTASTSQPGATGSTRLIGSVRSKPMCSQLQGT